VPVQEEHAAEAAGGRAGQQVLDEREERPGPERQRRAEAKMVRRRAVRDRWRDRGERARELRAPRRERLDEQGVRAVREVRAVLFEELEGLPERYRAPLVLCGLEEKSLEEAARLLGWTPGSVRGRLVRPDGRVVHVRATSAPVIGDDGSVLGRVGSVVDVTADITAERRRLAFVHSPVAQFRLDPDTRVREVNDALVHLLARPAGDLVGQRAIDLTEPGEADAIRARLADLVAGAAGSDRFHWHLDAVPRLGTLAGLELGAGVHICIVPPETAAAQLREV
jgi:PAS domain-containing protein